MNYIQQIFKSDPLMLNIIKTVYRIKAPLFRSDNGSRDVDIYIYASQKATKGYIPAAGDDIAGILWLQGYIKE